MKGTEYVSAAEGSLWVPRKRGETFEGVLVEKRMANTRFGPKPLISLADQETGEIVSLFVGNLKLRRLYRVPIETPIKLVYNGEETIMIGRRKKKVPDIRGYYPRGVTLEPEEPNVGKKGRKK